MSLSSSYLFNNMGRLGSDATDQTQRNLQNTRLANYMLSDYVSDKTSDSSIKFAIQQPTMMVAGGNVSPAVIDVNSLLTLKTEQERSVERIQLHQRPFVTVPYIGRGSACPLLESQLLQGEMVSDKKSVSTIMEQSFGKYTMYPTDNKMEEHVKSSVLGNDWIYGTDTRNVVPTK